MALVLRPSLQGRFALVYSGDPALQPRPEDLPDDAPDADKTERANQQVKWDHDLQVCRETGNWTTLVKPGDSPTVFRGELPRGIARRTLNDLFGAAIDGRQPATATAMLFRVWLREVSNLPNAKVTLVKEQGLEMADESIVETLDSISPAIIAELGGLVFQRMVELPKKS